MVRIRCPRCDGGYRLRLCSKSNTIFMAGPASHELRSPVAGNSSFGGDPLGRRDELGTTLAGHARDEVEDRAPGDAFIPGWEWIGGGCGIDSGAGPWRAGARGAEVEQYRDNGLRFLWRPSCHCSQPHSASSIPPDQVAHLEGGADQHSRLPSSWLADALTTASCQFTPRGADRKSV